MAQADILLYEIDILDREYSWWV